MRELIRCLLSFREGAFLHLVTVQTSYARECLSVQDPTLCVSRDSLVLENMAFEHIEYLVDEERRVCADMIEDSTDNVGV